MVALRELKRHHAHQPLRLFHATLGPGRAFLSEADVHAYERGWNHWPEPLNDRDARSTPMMAGWRDHANRER